MDEDRLRKKQEELRKRREGGGRNKDFWNPKPGPNKIRILPNWTKDFTADFFYETNYHKNLGPEKKTSCICPKAEGYDYCPICDEAKKLFGTKDKEDASYAKDIYKKTRVYWNIIDMEDYFEVEKWNTDPKNSAALKEHRGVQVWTTGSDILDQVIAYCLNPEYGDMTDPVKGRNITIVFIEGKNTKSGYNDYDIQPSPDRTVIEDPEWLDKMIDLKRFIKILTAEEMLALLNYTEVPATQTEVPATQTEVPQTSPPDYPKFKPCRGKFDNTDVECLACVEKEGCIQVRKSKTLAAQEAVKEIPKADPSVKPSDPKPETKPISNIEDKLAKIREKMAKKG